LLFINNSTILLLFFLKNILIISKWVNKAVIQTRPALLVNLSISQSENPPMFNMLNELEKREKER